MAVNNIDYLGNKAAANTNRQTSPAIWGSCPWLDILEGQVPGMIFYDDFDDLPLAPTLTTQIGYGKYKAFATSGDTITRNDAFNSVETAGGGLKLLHNTDNNSASIAQAFPSFYLANDSNKSGKLWFECCIAQSTIANHAASTFVGLFEVEAWTLATAVPLNASDAITNSASGIGFRISETGLGVVDTVVTDRATSFTNIGAGEGGTLAAYGFAKLGFVYDPAADTTRRIVFYLNNLECATKYTDANLAATSNLKANLLGLILASVSDTAANAEIYMKWWKVAQIFPN